MFNGKLLRICTNILFFSIYVHYVLSFDCTAVPLSLSQLTNCENGVCRLSQTAQIALPATARSSACLEFSAPGVAFTTRLNITLNSANFIYNGDVAYYSDDALANPHGFCSCSSLSAKSCSDIAVNAEFTDAIQCDRGNHGSCNFANVPFGGTYTVVYGWSMRRRFFIQKFLPTYTKIFNFKAATETAIWGWSYDGRVSTNYDKDAFAISVISDTSTQRVDFTYAVWDLGAPDDFFLLRNDLVNDLNEYNTGKIGWAKETLNGVKSLADMTKAIHVDVANCDENTFTYADYSINPSTILAQNQNYLSNVLAPKSVLRSKFYTQTDILKKGIPSVSIEPYEFLQEGWIFLDSSNYVRFYGINKQGVLVPQPAVNCYGSGLFLPPGSPDLIAWNEVDNKNWTIREACAPDDTRAGICVPYAALVCAPTYFVKDPYTLQTYIMTTVNARLTYTADPRVTHRFFLFKSTATGVVANSISITMKLWPSQQEYAVTYNSVGFSQIPLVNPYSNTQGVLNMPTTDGAITLAVTFKNLSLSFSKTSIVPKINSITTKGTDVFVTATSQTVPGTCYIGTSDPQGLIVTQTIDLEMKPVEFKYVMALSQFNGTATVKIQCYGRDSSSQFTTSYNLNKTILSPGVSGGEVTILKPLGIPTFRLPSFLEWDSGDDCGYICEAKQTLMILVYCGAAFSAIFLSIKLFQLYRSRMLKKRK